MSEVKKGLNKPCKIWFGTWNNPSDISKQGLGDLHIKLDARYTKGQLEKGEKEGTMHFQFITFLKDNVRLSTLKKVNKEIHWEPSRSEAANKYVMKEETRVDGPWEFGVEPKFGAPKKKKKLIGKMFGIKLVRARLMR